MTKKMIIVLAAVGTIAVAVATATTLNIVYDDKDQQESEEVRQSPSSESTPDKTAVGNLAIPIWGINVQLVGEQVADIVLAEEFIMEESSEVQSVTLTTQSFSETIASLTGGYSMPIGILARSQDRQALSDAGIVEVEDSVVSGPDGYFYAVSISDEVIDFLRSDPSSYMPEAEVEIIRSIVQDLPLFNSGGSVALP